MGNELNIVPVTIREAKQFVTEKHRHHKAPAGAKFAIGVECDEKLVGVVMVGRPVSRIIAQNRLTAEVIRLCTDGTPNACSALYSASWRTAKGMGYKRLITYILASETGVSLLASGWTKVKTIRGKSWDTPSRRRTDKAPTMDKILFEIRSGGQ